MKRLVLLLGLYAAAHGLFGSVPLTIKPFDVISVSSVTVNYVVDGGLSYSVSISSSSATYTDPYDNSTTYSRSSSDDVSLNVLSGSSVTVSIIPNTGFNSGTWSLTTWLYGNSNVRGTGLPSGSTQELKFGEQNNATAATISDIAAVRNTYTDKFVKASGVSAVAYALVGADGNTLLQDWTVLNSTTDVSDMVHGNYIRVCAFPETGHHISGVYINSDFYPGNYCDGLNFITIPIGGSGTIKPAAEANTYTVTYDANGGSVSPASGSVTYGSAIISMPTPTYPSYVFDGWYTAASGGTKISVGDTWTIAADTTLYAHWSPVTYTARFHCNYGSDPIAADVPVTYGSSFQMHSAVTHSGYEFSGWALQPTATVKDYDAGEYVNVSDLTFDGNGIAHFYAVWNANSYDVELNLNDGTGTALTNHVEYASEYGNALIEPVRTGYAFTGWWTETSGGTQVVTNTMVETAGNHKLYAHWAPNTYNVTFSGNGGDGSMDGMVLTYDSPTNLIACAFSRDGYDFIGWATNSVDVVEYAEGAAVTNLTAEAGGTVALYAKWKAQTYEVMFYANGGGLTNGEETVSLYFTVDEIYGEVLPDATNSNVKQVFAGWKYRHRSGEWIPIMPSSTVPPPSSGATNMVAHWTRNDPFARALDAEELDFEAYSDPDGSRYASLLWGVVSNETFVGGSAAYVKGDASSGIFKLYRSYISTELVGSGTLTFRWRINSDSDALVTGPSWDENDWNDFDTKLSFHIGSNIVYGVKGSEALDEWYRFSDFANERASSCDDLPSYVGWTNETVSITAAEGVTNTVSWRYDGCSDAYGNAGEAWLDCVTWTPSGSSETTTIHLVPYSWLREKFPGHDGATDAELESLAEGNSPNGKSWSDGTPVKVWQDYVAGTNPYTNELLRAHIGITNNVPYVWWTPPAGTGGAQEDNYRIIGAPSLTGPWTTNAIPADGVYRFFKVDIVWP